MQLFSIHKTKPSFSLHLRLNTYKLSVESRYKTSKNNGSKVDRRCRGDWPELTLNRAASEEKNRSRWSRMRSSLWKTKTGGGDTGNRCKNAFYVFICATFYVFNVYFANVLFLKRCQTSMQILKISMISILSNEIMFSCVS